MTRTINIIDDIHLALARNKVQRLPCGEPMEDDLPIVAGKDPKEGMLPGVRRVQMGWSVRVGHTRNVLVVVDVDEKRVYLEDTLFD